MVAIKNVADVPFLANLGAGLDRLAAVLKKVPVPVWRTVIIAVALFWICHSLAKAFWYVAPTPTLPSPTVIPTAPSAAAVSEAQRDVDIDSVIAMNLLGDYNSAPVAADDAVTAPEEPVKMTELDLKLQGILASNEPEFSWAIIGPDNDQKMYKVGDEIDGARGVEIVEIYDLKVRLDNNGTLEELWLYGEDGTKVASSDYTPPPVQTEDEPVRASVSREQIQQARNIGDVVRFMVATENGRMIGYKVRPGRKRELFDQVGLQTDDIVVSVNGIEVNEPQKVREVYQALKNATSADLQVMRDGSTHSIQISMSSEG